MSGQRPPPNEGGLHRLQPLEIAEGDKDPPQMKGDYTPREIHLDHAVDEDHPQMKGDYTTAVFLDFRPRTKSIPK